MVQMNHPYAKRAAEVPEDMVPLFEKQGYKTVETETKAAEDKPAPKKTTTRRTSAK